MLLLFITMIGLMGPWFTETRTTLIFRDQDALCAIEGYCTRIVSSTLYLPLARVVWVKETAPPTAGSIERPRDVMYIVTAFPGLYTRFSPYEREHSYSAVVDEQQ